ncbi:hypothetical protein DQT32_03740 [Salmonella enterica subsp. enterica serovar Braenderup]|nr:hypothetical protein [Salmonella enterica subsp. enterica serovar Braenderup]
MAIKFTPQTSSFKNKFRVYLEYEHGDADGSQTEELVLNISPDKKQHIEQIVNMLRYAETIIEYAHDDEIDLDPYFSTGEKYSKDNIPVVGTVVRFSPDYNHIVMKGTVVELDDEVSEIVIYGDDKQTYRMEYEDCEEYVFSAECIKIMDGMNISFNYEGIDVYVSGVWDMTSNYSFPAMMNIKSMEYYDENGTRFSVIVD